MLNNVGVSANRVLEPHAGYDFVASRYEEWPWVRFWDLNEAPIVRRWLKNLDIGIGLDAGSGTGPYISNILELGHRCIAIDVSREMLKINRARTLGYSVRSMVQYVQGDISSIPFRSGKFDWILCSRVLSHVSDLNSTLLEFARLLKKGRECLIADVHPDHPYTNVAIPVDSRKVAIETYKHSLASYKRLVSSIEGLQLTCLDEYHFKDLFWKPPKATFAKLYDHSNPAVFYISRLRKL
jgi:ubiquinone/menaquinone biosynthesis C-methylase UbiE